MPIVTISWWSGRTKEQKKKVVEGITKVIVETLAIEPKDVHIIINDIPKENWGLKGKLCADL